MTDKPQERVAEALEELAALYRRDRTVADRERRQAATEAEEERERRRIGSRGELRKLSFLTMARAVPALAEMFSRKIPPEAWALDGETATVSCPCGALPESEHGVPVPCPGECGRHFLYDGEAVRVAYPDQFTPARHLAAVADQPDPNAQTPVES
jgi:hypothetical protein